MTVPAPGTVRAPGTAPVHPLPMILAIRQSTDGIESARAFDYWRSTALPRVAVTPIEDAAPFGARRIVAVSAHGTLFHTHSSPLVVERQAPHIRRDGADDVSLSLILAGRGHHEQGNRGGIVDPGGIGIVTLDRPFVSGAHEAYEEMRLTVSRAAFLAHVGLPEAVAGRTFAAGGLSELLSAYLRSLAGSIGRMTDAEASHAFEGALHLLRGVVGLEAPERAEDLPPAAVRSLVGAYIERRLHDPTLGPSAICTALSISRSRLYLAFAGDGGVAAAIRDARLDRARARLASRAWDGETAATIMMSCGFRDGTVFGRAFRRRFGLSPRDYRHLTKG